MEIWLLLALFAPLALLPVLSDNETDDDTTPVDADPLLVESDEDVVGTMGDDIFHLSVTDASSTFLSIDASDGDDLIDLTDRDGSLDAFDPLLGSVTIEGGSGDDTILASPFEATIDGGDGDDRIEVFNGQQSTVSGGAGDDYLITRGGFSDLLVLEGGDGNDTLDGSTLENANLFGGDGNDLLISQGIADGGAGYAVNSDAGAGNDILRYTGPTATSSISPIPAATRLEGGSGIDLFELTISEGAIGNGPFEDPDALAASEKIVFLRDFEPDVEMIQIDARIEDPAYSVTEALLEETSRGTDLTVRYETDNGVTRDVVIGIGALGVDWGDVEFVGENVPLLVPLGGSFA